MRQGFIDQAGALQLIADFDPGEPPEGWAKIDVPGHVTYGWVFDGATWFAPEDPNIAVPESVSMFQARAALIGAGLFEQVDAYCHAQGGLILQAWEYANVAPRNGSLINALGHQLGLSDAQIDALFRAAAQIEV